MDGIINKTVLVKIRYTGLIIILMLITCRGFCPDSIPETDMNAQITTDLSEKTLQKNIQDESAIHISALFNDFTIVIQ